MFVKGKTALFYFWYFLFQMQAATLNMDQALYLFETHDNKVDHVVGTLPHLRWSMFDVDLY